jgi:hypothetical protein
MEEDFRALLLADTGVAALVGTRVNFGAHPQGQPLPALVLQTISDQEDFSMQGPSGLLEGRVQVDCYADTYGGSKLLSRATRSALNGYRGGGFLLVTQVSARDSREGGSNEATRPYRVSMDFLTHWRPE